MLVLALELLLVSGNSHREAASEGDRPRMVEADEAVVAADHRICSDLGARVLKKGGHAVDAAVAVALCQGVVNPGASGIGGGDFLLLRLADGTAEAYDMRETAPSLATEVRLHVSTLQGFLELSASEFADTLWQLSESCQASQQGPFSSINSTNEPPIVWTSNCVNAF